MALSGLTDTLAQLLAWLSLLWLSAMWRRRYLTHNHFRSTISLAWSLALHLLFCSAGEVFAVEGNKHTHTHTHTYTHIHTHKHTNTHIYVLSTRDVFLIFNTPINTYRYSILIVTVVNYIFYHQIHICIHMKCFNFFVSIVLFIMLNTSRNLYLLFHLGTYIPPNGSSKVLQLPSHLSSLTVNE